MNNTYRIFVYDPINDLMRLLTYNFFNQKDAFKITKKYLRNEGDKDTLFVLINKDDTKRSIYVSSTNRPISRNAYNEAVTRSRAKHLLIG